MNTATIPPPRFVPRGDPARAVHDATLERPFSRAELADLAMEVRHECARIERSRAPGESSDELHGLMLALQRIDDGTYGFCVGCGCRITLARLQVMPATQTCVGCAR